MDLIKKLEKEIEPNFDKKGAHDMTHTKRVLKVALQIAKYEKKADKDILIASCLLHDIARKKEDEKKCRCHAEEGARMAYTILKKINFPEKKIDKVVYAIKCHRKSTGIKPETTEAKILQDSDRIDIFGAVGIARTFAHLSKTMVLHSDTSRALISFEDTNSDSILEQIRSLLFAKRNKFHTFGGWEIVQDRLNFLKLFIKQFEKEWA